MPQVVVACKVLLPSDAVIHYQVWYYLVRFFQFSHFFICVRKGEVRRLCERYDKMSTYVQES